MLADVNAVTHRRKICDLPNELSNAIAALLEVPDLKRFRSTCKLYGGICATYIFAEIWSTLQRTSFEHFLCIAHHPTLSTFVQSFHLDTTALSERIKNLEDWKTLVERGSQDVGGSVDDKGIEQSYETFSSMLSQQLIASPDLSKMVRAIHQFTSLKTISVRSQELVDIEGFPLAAKSDEGEGSLPALIQKYILESVGSGTNPPNITGLSLELPWTSVESRLGECVEPRVSSSLRNWQSVHKIDITLMANSEFTMPDRPFQALRTFLNKLVDLQELTLILDFDHSRISGVPLENALDMEFKWPLKSLELGGFRARSEPLLKFMKLQFSPSAPLSLAIHELLPHFRHLGRISHRRWKQSRSPSRPI